MMAGIRGKDTKPELIIRRGLHALGFRYRLHARDVPGKPDLVFPRFQAVIMVNGCFWHRHDCHLFRMPSTRPEFWSAKIGRNVERDSLVQRQLAEAGWRKLVVWECALKGRTALGPETVVTKIAQWLPGTEAACEIRGTI